MSVRFVFSTSQVCYCCFSFLVNLEAFSIHVQSVIVARIFFSGCFSLFKGAKCTSVVRAFTHGVSGCQIDPSWGAPIVLFLVPASAPRLCVTKAVVCAILSVGWCI